MTAEQDTFIVNRFELINHMDPLRDNSRQFLLAGSKDFEVHVSLQNEGRTVKVFLAPNAVAKDET